MALRWSTRPGERGSGATIGSGATVDDVDVCRRVVAHASRSFYWSSTFFPEEVRRDAWVLYAFCRTADDTVDEAPAVSSSDDRRETPDGAVATMRRWGQTIVRWSTTKGRHVSVGDEPASAPAVRLDRLRVRLEAVYRGQPEDRPVDRAFARLVERHRLPRVLPEALLAGMEEDLGPRVVANEDELERYAVRVAGVVGLMMSRLMGVVDPDVLARANDLGVAMQLTNIARDVGEDALRGRVYLPSTWLADVGLTAGELVEMAARAVAEVPSTSAPDPRLVRVVFRLLERAEVLYARADVGVPYLPPPCRWAIASARQVYSAIGVDLAAHGYDPLTYRAHVSTPEKVRLLARARFDSGGPSVPPNIAPPIASARPLIDAMVKPEDG